MFDIDLSFLGASQIEYPNATTTERFDLGIACKNLDFVRLPKPGETLRLISPANGFSSAALIKVISDRLGIDQMRATTLRVGKKEADLLAECNIDYCEIIACGIMKENGSYKYADYVSNRFLERGYILRYAKNHSKVILIQTKQGEKMTIETSSNLNENPKIEQFAITNSNSVYDWYLSTLKEMGVFS